MGMAKSGIIKMKKSMLIREIIKLRNVKGKRNVANAREDLASYDGKVLVKILRFNKVVMGK